MGLRIGLAGDVMIGRLVNTQISASGPRYPWGDLLPLLKSTDLNIVNLENTITTSDRIVPKVFNFKCDPANVSALKEARIDVVNLANNHIMDFSGEGLLETTRVLDNAGISHVGAGASISDAKMPAVFKIRGFSVGVIGCTDNEPDWAAGKGKPGTYYVDTGSGISDIRSSILSLRSRVDFLVLSIHWGPNMTERPSKEFRRFAHQAIDLGVDLLHGHSSHLFQGIEFYRSGVILYDTGDFVDDYYVDPFLRNDLSFFFVAHAGKRKLQKLLLYPVVVAGMQVNRSVGDDYRFAVSRMVRLSRELLKK